MLVLQEMNEECTENRYSDNNKSQTYIILNKTLNLKTGEKTEYQLHDIRTSPYKTPYETYK